MGSMGGGRIIKVTLSIIPVILSTMSSHNVLQKIVQEVEAGRRVSLCVIVETRGSTPQPAGVFVCVDDAAQMTGSLGGGCVEADVRRLAHELLRDGTSQLVTFQLDHDFGYDDGMICGGQMDVAIIVLSSATEIAPYKKTLADLRSGTQAVIPATVKKNNQRMEYKISIDIEPKLIIVGAGHISKVLAKMTASLGFDITVIDDRSDYANDQRFPPPMKTVAGPIAQTLSEQPIDANTYIVIVTRGHNHDEEALRAVLNSGAKYIGMIGSRRKIKVIFDDLKHSGATDEQLARVHAPIGLNIKAVTMDEISLSIAAQLVETRRADHHKMVEGPFPV